MQNVIQPETIAVVGTGDMGGSLGVRLASLGYKVVYGSRNPEEDKVKDLLAASGQNASATTPQEAAAQADIIITAVPFPAITELVQNLGNLEGKILVDISSPVEQGQDGYPDLVVETSGAEMIQQWNPGARVVKAFGTLGSQIIDNPFAEGGRVTMPIAGNDRAAKETIARIALEMELDPVDFGPLRMSRLIEAMQRIYMIPLVQRRKDSWEFCFRRSTHWHLRNLDGWFAPVCDADNLADLPPPRV